MAITEIPERRRISCSSRHPPGGSGRHQHVVPSAAKLLASIGYQLLGAQDEFLGMVADVLGMPTTAKPEDFVAVDYEGRLGRGTRPINHG